ncbi:MAG: single-stranded DNA-binding protein [Bacteroidales bacterium]|nr:single-stranded DNA-binding protein [Bacteroidales bacterium]
MSLNKVMLIGNVGRDPEVRYLDGNSGNGAGTKVATFTLATSERYRDRNGEARENTEWHNIVAWRNSADLAERFIKKGTQVYIEGKLRTRSYNDSAGVKKYTTEVVVDNIQLLGRRGDGDDAGTPAGGYQRPAYGQQQGYGQHGPSQQYGQEPQVQYSQVQYNQPAQPVQPVSPAADEGSDDLPF